MGTDDIDPVQFGRLLELSEQNNTTMQEIKRDVKILAGDTAARLALHDDKFNNIELREEKRKHLLLGALGAGTLGGATFGEVIKNFFKHLIS